MKKLIFTFIAVMCCTVMKADFFTVDGYTCYIKSENTVGIKNNNPDLSGIVVIPTTVTNPNDGKTYNVTRIEDNCFIFKGITSVTIPEGITSIGKNAFDGCQITDLVIPSTVTSIERQAFSNCSSLTSVTIKSGSIGNEAFSGCSNLTSLSLQEGVTSIGEHAFDECKKIAGDLVIPSTVTNIGEMAFYNIELTSVKVFALVPPELGYGAFKATCPCYVPDVEKYKECDGWKNYNIQLLTYFRLGDQMYSLNETGGGRYLDQELTFNDKVSYMSYYDFTANKLTYSRTFEATGVWQAWFVPFDVTVGKMNAAGMEVAQIADVQMGENEQVITAAAKMTNTDAVVKANTPYMVMATQSEVNMTLDGPVIKKSADAELEEHHITMQSSYNTSKIGGIYHVQSNSDWYALSPDGTFIKINDAVLQAQRLWLTIKPRTDSPYVDPSASSEPFIDANELDYFTTPCTDCPSIEVTKGDKTVKLYNPEKVEFKKE